MGFCAGNQSQSNTGKYIDPYAQVPGASGLRGNFFNYLSGSMPASSRAGAAYASALQGAAADPGWATVSENARRTAAGDYLHGSPELDRAMASQRAAAEAEAANETARIKSGYARNGMGFSTAAQQADQSAHASATARANEQNAQTYLQNYLTERGAQNNAGTQLAQATGAPLNYLSQVPGAYTAGLGPSAGILSGLIGNGSMFTTGSKATDNPSIGSSILSGIGAL